MTIRGTGFTGGGTVNFVRRTQVGTGTYNPPVPATIVARGTPRLAAALPTCIQVLSPGVHVRNGLLRPRSRHREAPARPVRSPHYVPIFHLCSDQADRDRKCREPAPERSPVVTP